MSLRPQQNRFARGGIIQPETITPELSPIADLAPPVDEDEKQRRDCVAAITAQLPKLLEDMKAESLAQAVGFSACFRRFGDFLMIEMERKENAGSTYDTKFANTINLAKVDRISIQRGSDVKTEDQTFGLDRYSVARMRSDETFAQYYTRRSPIKVPSWRPFIQTTEIAMLYGSAIYGHRFDFDCQSDHYFHVADVPQPSVDDLLVFHGSESFHVPFGRGDTVLFQVMHAIEKGWEKAPLPSLTG